MDSLKLTKRLIVQEDINFDTAGTGEVVDIVHADGTTAQGHKVNASHVPLSLNARNETGAGNLDDAVKFLSRRIDKISVASTLTEDLTVEFLSTDTVAQIQAKIDAVPKNLGGHTVTFQFPEEFAWSLLTPLEWKGFYNGNVIVNGGSGVSVADGKELGALFMLHDNQCRFTVRDIDFTHNNANTQFAIKAERCSSVEVIDCDFTGVAGSTYAMKLYLSNGAFSGGSFTNEAKVYVDGALGPGGSVPERKLFDIFPSFSDVENGAKRLDQDNTLTGCLSEDSDYYEFFKKAVELKSAGYIPVKTNDEFEADLAAYGQCGAFVINETAGSIRLPKLNGFIQIGTPGTLHNAGLPNISGSVRHIVNAGNTIASGALEMTQTGSGDYDPGHAAKLVEISLDASRTDSMFGAADTVQPRSAELRYFIKVSSGDDSGDPSITLSISDVLNILARHGFTASGGVVSGGADIRGSLTVRSGASVSGGMTISGGASISGGLVVDGESVVTMPQVASGYLPSSGGWTAWVSSGGRTDELSMTPGSGVIVRRVVSTVSTTVNPPYALVNGGISYNNPVVPLVGSITYNSSTSQWTDSIPDTNHLGVAVDSDTGLIVVNFWTYEEGGVGDDMFGFLVSGYGEIHASGVMTSAYEDEHGQPQVSSAGSFTCDVVVSGAVTSTVTVSSGAYNVFDNLESGGGTTSGAIVENQPFSTTVGGYTVELTSNGGFSVHGSGASVTLSGGSVGVSTESGLVAAYDGGDLGAIGTISMGYGGVEIQYAEYSTATIVLDRDGGITANGSAITQASSAFDGTSLGSAELAGGVKYVCASALTVLSVGSAAPGCNGTIIFTVANGAVVTPPANVPYFGVTSYTVGSSYIMMINGDAAVCNEAAIVPGV